MKTVSKRILSLCVAAVLAVGMIATPMTVYAAVRWLDKDAANDLLQKAKQDGLSYVRVSSNQYDGIQANAAKSLAGVRLEYDTMSGNTVSSRLYIAKPELFAHDMVLTGETASGEALKVQQKFERFFSNKVSVLNLSQQAQWGQPVRIAVRTDFTAANTGMLHAYTYDSTRNTYSLIKQPNFSFDGNGKYFYFTTNQGGIIIFSDGTLMKRSVPLPVAPQNTNGSNITSGNSGGRDGSGGGYTPLPPSNIPATGVIVTPDSLSLSLGASGQLTATVTPANATDKSVTWSSLDESIATVDGDGLVTAVAAGNVTVTATTNDGGFSAGCVVSVDIAPPTIIPVTGVTVSPNSATLIEGSTTQLTAMVSPANATNKAVAWSSSNTGVATVDGDGLVAAVAAGNVTVTATTNDGGFSAGCVVSVDIAPPTIIPVTSVTVSPNSATITEGGTTQLTASVSPANATNKAITWSSSNTGVATVDGNGLVTAVAAGSATITVTTGDGGFTADCTVTVIALVNAQTPTISAHPMGTFTSTGQSHTISVTANVSDGGTLSYQWYWVTDPANDPDGSPIPGATSSSYVVTSSVATSLLHYCVVTNTNTSPSITGSQTASARSTRAQTTFF